jgi:nucleoid DNA-binding protein
MSDRIEHDDLVRLVAQRTGQDVETVDKVVDAFLDEIYQAIKRG